MKTYKHILELGKPGKRKADYTLTYNYSHTKNVCLDVSRNGIRLTANLSKKYTAEDLIGYKGYLLFADGIKKGLVAYLLSYSEPFTTGECRIRINDDGEQLVDISSGFISSLITKRLYHPLTDKWREARTIDSILSFTKSAQDSRTAACYSLLLSKSKEYEAERFIYLWMSFNGLYGYLGKKIAERENDSGRIADSKAITELLKCYGLGNHCVFEKESVAIAREVIKVLEKAGFPLVSEASLKAGGEHSELAHAIENCLTFRADHAELHRYTGDQKDLSAYGYLLCYFSYYFRCKLIHADKPLPLLSYAAEYELRCLKIINQLLEGFLEQELPDYFDDAYVEEVIKELD